MRPFPKNTVLRVFIDALCCPLFSKLLLLSGSVSSISVEEGDEVLEGTEVAIVVAMKMNNSLKVKLCVLFKGSLVLGRIVLDHFDLMGIVIFRHLDKHL